MFGWVVWVDTESCLWIQTEFSVGCKTETVSEEAGKRFSDASLLCTCLNNSLFSQFFEKKWSVRTKLFVWVFRVTRARCLWIKTESVWLQNETVSWGSRKMFFGRKLTLFLSKQLSFLSVLWNKVVCAETVCVSVQGYKSALDPTATEFCCYKMDTVCWEAENVLLNSFSFQTNGFEPVIILFLFPYTKCAVHTGWIEHRFASSPIPTQFHPGFEKPPKTRAGNTSYAAALSKWTPFARSDRYRKILPKIRKLPSRKIRFPKNESREKSTYFWKNRISISSPDLDVSDKSTFWSKKIIFDRDFFEKYFEKYFEIFWKIIFVRKKKVEKWNFLKTPKMR